MKKQDVLNNLDQVKQWVNEVENKKEEKVLGIAIKNRFTGEIIFQSTKTTYKEAIEEKGDNNLSGANLSGADLREANLSGANLREANLREADLCRANLYEANLREANLREANLRGANLREANLYEANLCRANLSGAELQNAKFYGKGGTQKLKRSQLTDFLNALGFQIDD